LLVVAGSSMPQSLSLVMGADSTAGVDRLELDLWRRIVRSRPRRAPVFGDYGIVSPLWSDRSAGGRVTPNIRYTAPTQWLVFRGNKLPGKMAPQYRGLARQLRRCREYVGHEASWGDEYIAQCAESRQFGAGFGSPQRWIAVGTNHHLQFVSAQVAGDSAAS